MTAAVPAGLHWYQHNKKASLWQWKAPKTHAMSLLFLFNKSNDSCPSVFTITHHLQGSSVCVFSSFCPLIFFPYFLCPTFARCPLLSEDLASSSHHAWVPTSILATKRAEYMKCHTNTALLCFQTQRDAAVKPLPRPNTRNTVANITTMALHTVFGVSRPITYNSTDPGQGGSTSLEDIAIGGRGRQGSALPFCAHEVT